MSENKQKIIDRINKLFSLADTSRNQSEEEVSEALSKAKTLMAEYDLSESDLIQGQSKESKWEFLSQVIYSEKQTFDKWQRMLFFGISKLTHTRIWQGGNRGSRYVKIVGESVDVGIAIALYNILKKQARRLAEEKYVTRTDRRSYCEGFAGGVQQQAKEKVKSLSAASENKYAIISTEKTEWLAKKGVILDEGVTVKSYRNPIAYKNGYKDGYASETSYNQKALV